jgi:hypothetical protein
LQPKDPHPHLKLQGAAASDRLRVAEPRSLQAQSLDRKEQDGCHNMRSKSRLFSARRGGRKARQQIRDISIKRMEIGPYIFRHVCKISPVRNEDGSVRQYMPQRRFTNPKDLPLSKYGHGPFCKFKVPNTFRTSGVYALQIADTVKYIGECRDLSARYNAGYGNISPRNCFKGGQDTNCRLNNLIYLAAMDGLAIELWFHSTPNFKIAELEVLAIQQCAWNRK